MTKTVGIVGARGYTGSELLRILHRHPEVEVVWAGSREKAGEPVDDYPGLTFSDTDPEFVAANPVDVVFLALPDGASASFLGVIPDETVVIDISADHRWDTDWAYGLPELFRDRIAGSQRSADPGCSATGRQLAVAPLMDAAGGDGASRSSRPLHAPRPSHLPRPSGDRQRPDVRSRHRRRGQGADGEGVCVRAAGGDHRRHA